MEKKRCFEEDLDTTTTLNNSSSSKFGCLILHAVFSPRITRNAKHMSEHGLFMLTSDSDSDPDDAEKYISKFRSKSRSVNDSLSSITTGSNDNDDDKQLVLRVTNLGFPLSYRFNMYDKEVVGSCDGLVCLQDRRLPRFEPHQVCLWNPATGQSRILPQSITCDGDIVHDTVAVFGFDFETKDYKVVLFTGLCPKWNGYGPTLCFCRVQVYSLATDSWRLLKHIPCLPGFPYGYENVICLNGTCFFLARFQPDRHLPCLPRNDRFIISFDLAKEIITPIQLPDHDRNQELLLCNYLGDKIALFTSASQRVYQDTTKIRLHEDFNIWVLNYEHGSSSSSSSSSVDKQPWTNLHSFRIPGAASYEPRGISNDGKYAFLESPAEIGSPYRKMNLYNLATKEVKKNFLLCDSVMSKAVYAYKPSELSVSGGSSSSSRP